MLVLNTVLVFAYSLFSFCDGSIVETLPKCSIKDNECLKSLNQKLITGISKSGIPELNVSPHDSIELENIDITVLDTITLTILAGVATGISTCKLNNYRLDLETLTAFKEVTCDNIVIECDAKVSGKSDIIESATGVSSLKGKAHGKAEIDKLNLKYQAPFKIMKKIDGESYLKYEMKAIKYTYEIGNTKFSAKNLFLGGTDVTNTLLPYANANWGMFMKFIGPKLFNIGTKSIFSSANYVYSRIPLKKIIIEDLSSYAE